MKIFHDAGIRTTRFISPIFSGITNNAEIIKRVKNQRDFVWLENLNLRAGYKTVILDYIAEKHPGLVSLYHAIYQKGDCRYWSELDEEMRQFCREDGLLYVRDDDSVTRPFCEAPIVVNYFFHWEIIPSVRRKE